MSQPRAFHIMAKPIGPCCNLACRYCFYLEKHRLYEAGERWRMSDETLEVFVRDYIAAQDVPEINFAWQGGEPTLLGLPFFEQAVALQRQHCPAGKRISNAFQTNGVLLDDAWGAFLAREKFLVGLSIDGPGDLTDVNRRHKDGRGAVADIERGAAVLRKHGVEFNILCCVHRDNARKPIETYDFLRRLGTPFLQFIPIIERQAPAGGDLDLARPPQIAGVGGTVTPWSVKPEDYGDFLIAILDRWVRRDVGRVFVQLFDVQLGLRMGLPAGLCVYAETCGNGLALEHNGDLYACDHYVYPETRLGNIRERPLAAMVDSPEQRRFGDDKRDRLTAQCRRCPHLRQCHGECPKHRILTSVDGEAGHPYLCAGLLRFFAHANPVLDRMAAHLRAGRPAGAIMAEFVPRDADGRRPGPNDACPCGSGRKFKKCCGR